MPKFNEEYDSTFRVLVLPYIFPLAYIRLMGSVYCTIAIAVERYLAVTYPFLPRRCINDFFMILSKVVRWQNLVTSYPWIAPGWRAGGAIRGKEGIKSCSVA